MARFGPRSAVSDCFICIGDQPSLDFGGARNPDGQGFAAFDRVVAGMDVVRAIHRAPADGENLTPPILPSRGPHGSYRSNRGRTQRATTSSREWPSCR